MKAAGQGNKNTASAEKENHGVFPKEKPGER